jgi:hypothetical protein
MDLLLESDDHLPVIGEIKAPTDVDLLLALVQTLTYASELCSDSQRQRLQRCYPGHFQHAGRQCDIILFFSMVQGGNGPALLEETQCIAAQFLGSLGGEDVKRIRNIRFLNTGLPEWPEGQPPPQPPFTFQEL